MLRVELWQESTDVPWQTGLVVCLGGGLRLLNSGALVMEVHRASGLMKFPGRARIPGP